MPANPTRRMIVARMFPADIDKLEVLVVARFIKTGRPMDRSKLINALIDEAYQRLPKKERSAIERRRNGKD